jgi:hypothetical protein
MKSLNHPSGAYRFLPAKDAYSSGVAVESGWEIVGIRFRKPLPFEKGVKKLDDYFEENQISFERIISIELRSGSPFSFLGFDEFNDTYYKFLESRGLIFDSINPIARTNVCPSYQTLDVPSLYGAHFYRKSKVFSNDYVIAGSAECKGSLEVTNIVARDDLSPQGLRDKVDFVLNEMQERLYSLVNTYIEPTEINVYTVHDIPQLNDQIHKYFPGLTNSQIVLWKSAPPIKGLEFEMDLRRLSASYLIN